MNDAFTSIPIDVPDDLFAQLQASAAFEDVAKGRQGAVLVRPDPQRGVPIVRTTSRYTVPAHCFGALHLQLADQIANGINATPFNNALFERYTNEYSKMGFHSDQALDLEAGSVIAILSSYAHPPAAGEERKLIVEPKAGGDRFELPLSNNTAVVFSVETNRQFKHKIVLDRSTNPPENVWIGLTFRTSPTFVRYDGDARLPDGSPLTIADEDEQREFFSLRGRENREPDFVWPTLNYTISQSDLLPPTSPGVELG